MTRERDSAPDGQFHPSVSPGEARERLELAVDLLRREWRSGFDAGMPYRAALGSVRRLRGLAPTEQAAADLARVIDELDAYGALPREQRPDALRGIADSLKRLIPRMAARDPVRRTTGARATPRSPEGVAGDRARVNSSDPPNAPPPVEPFATVPAVAPLPAVIRRSPDDPVTVLKGAGGATSKKLAKLGVETVGDLLLLSPRRHIDYSQTIRIGEALNLQAGQDVTVRGRITDLQLHRGPGAPRVTIRLADNTGWVRVTWFNQYLANVLKTGDEIAVSGALESAYGPLSFTGPEWEKVSGAPGGGVSTGRIVPVYPLTAGLAQKSMRNFTRQALDSALDAVDEYLPDAVLHEAGNLLPLRVAIGQVHYPDAPEQLKKARERLAFDELFLLQIGLVRRKQERQAFDGIAIQADAASVAAWEKSLPFRLTNAQRSAMQEIFADIARTRPMTRLLQGDVGSGKTAVAAGAMFSAVVAGHQAALMAPTEILAEQHLQGLTLLYSGLEERERPSVALLTGSTKTSDRRRILEQASEGVLDILVGTHAIIQDGVVLPRLALSIVDEQHRFGVRQRASLPDRVEGRLPHQLAMTATPIPRTLNLVLNGDLDVSILAERPPGRVPVETHRYIGAERDAAYDVVRQEVGAGRQVFVICPLVEASEAIEAKAAVDEAERLQNDVFPEMRIETLHGRMKAREKDAVMSGFREGHFDVLVSTSVIEVGIDVPNATVMLIEGADRFGLAQLHQFRGRVGRGSARSYCLLLADEASPDGEERLQTMVESDDGFLLAEKDLEIRGPGDFIGTRQSGLPEMQWLEGVFDTRLLERARHAAERLLLDDPDLSQPEHRRLGDRFARFWERAAPEKAV